MKRSRLVTGIGTLRREGVISTLRTLGESVRFEAWKWWKTRVEPTANRAVHRLRYGRAAPERYRRIHVDPRRVEYLLSPHFWNRISKFTTHVRGGEWDRNRTTDRMMIRGATEGFDRPTLVHIDNYQLYASAVDHFENGTPWRDTEIYRWLTEEWLDSDQELYMNRYGSERRIDSRLENLDELYHHMREHGYLTQREIHDREEAPFDSPALEPEHHEVAVDIGRDGEIILDDGRHRFIVARILGVETLPVRVLVRHSQWQQLRAEISRADSVDELSKKAAERLDHPDVQDVLPEGIRSDRDVA